MTHRLTRCRRSGCSASSWAWSRAPGTSGSPRTCHQPRVMVSWVQPGLRSHPVISASVGRARPKSSIFKSQSSFTAKLEGFRSLKRMHYFTATFLRFSYLWIIPAEWMYFSPRMIWYTMNLTWSSVSFCILIILFRSKSINGVTRYLGNIF